MDSGAVERGQGPALLAHLASALLLREVQFHIPKPRLPQRGMFAPWPARVATGLTAWTHCFWYLALGPSRRLRALVAALHSYLLLLLE